MSEGDWGDVSLKQSKATGTIYAVLNMANAKLPRSLCLEGSGLKKKICTDVLIAIFMCLMKRRMKSITLKKLPILSMAGVIAHLRHDSPR